MSHSEICPVCKGKGKVKNDRGIKTSCYGCSGRGWVTVGIDYPVPRSGSCKKKSKPGEWFSNS